MHTLEGKTKSGVEFVCNHNSDWSGDAFVRWLADDALGQYAGRQVEIPGEVLKALALKIARQTIEEWAAREDEENGS